MLITFTCNAYENITYLSDIATRLLSLMGHSGNVPGAIKAEHVAEALANLQHGIAQVKDQPSAAKANDDDDKEISLSNRAVPLINLLTAAAKKNCDVIWQQR